ncbi:MAG: hypothetical protein LC650_04400 [Actinobacteria bacterium]|nr:hypothetical protein [Actinomycetota bacterium]
MRSEEEEEEEEGKKKKKKIKTKKKKAKNKEREKEKKAPGSSAPRPIPSDWALVNMFWKPAKTCRAHKSLRVPKGSPGLHIVAECSFDAGAWSPIHALERQETIRLDFFTFCEAAPSPHLAAIARLVAWERCFFGQRPAKSLPENTATRIPDKHLTAKMAFFEQLDPGKMKVDLNTNRVWIELDAIPFRVLVDWFNLAWSPGHAALLLSFGIRNLHACILDCLKDDILNERTQITDVKATCRCIDDYLALDKAINDESLNDWGHLCCFKSTTATATCSAPSLYPWTLSDCDWEGRLASDTPKRSRELERIRFVFH